MLYWIFTWIFMQNMVSTTWLYWRNRISLDLNTTYLNIMIKTSTDQQTTPKTWKTSKHASSKCLQSHRESNEMKTLSLKVISLLAPGEKTPCLNVPHVAYHSTLHNSYLFKLNFFFSLKSQRMWLCGFLMSYASLL